MIFFQPVPSLWSQVPTIGENHWFLPAFVALNIAVVVFLLNCVAGGWGNNSTDQHMFAA